MILFDAHVHIHEAFPLDVLLGHARVNFIRHVAQDSPRPAAFILFLAETKGCDVFSALKAKADGYPDIALQEWRITPTQEPESLLASHRDGDGHLFILAGRQLVTTERIEVLALATPEKFSEGRTLAETVEAVRRHGGLAVLPWGVGKWLGRRGKTIEDFVGGAAPEGLFVGDNGGRPSFWPAPRLFQTAAARGIRLLPGSDPLPLSEEDRRVGSYGGWMEGEITADHPARDIRLLLTDRSQPVVPFGRRMDPWRFFKMQAALRRLKRV